MLCCVLKSFFTNNRVSKGKSTKIKKKQLQESNIHNSKSNKQLPQESYLSTQKSETYIMLTVQFCNFILRAVCVFLFVYSLYISVCIAVIWTLFRQPSTTCSTSLPAQQLRPSGFSSCRPHSLELSPRFYPGPDHQCRLFQTFAR